MKNLLFCVAIVSLLNVGCGMQLNPSPGGSNPPAKKVTAFSYDGIKLIQNGNTNLDDETSYSQQFYNINVMSRLLMRFESLRNVKGSVLLGQDDDVWIRITVVNSEDEATAVAGFKLCPMVRGDWMMLSTWYRAHPFGKSGRWTQDGGDYDILGCINAQDTIPNDPLSGSGSDTNAVYFKITRWFQDFVIGRNSNFGHVLINTGNNVRIYGDASGSYSPRILWNEEIKTH